MTLTLSATIGSPAHGRDGLREVLQALAQGPSRAVRVRSPSATVLLIMVTLRDLDIVPNLLEQFGRSDSGWTPFDVNEFRRVLRSLLNLFFLALGVRYDGS